MIGQSRKKGALMTLDTRKIILCVNTFIVFKTTYLVHVT